jgi:nicotinamide mononucleotide transporter
MKELWVQLDEVWRTTGRTEIAAVLLALAYLILAIRENIACWAAAFISSCLYVVVLFQARLYMESALNIFYAGMAVYGYWQWRGGIKAEPLRIGHWSWSRHLYGLTAIVAASLLSSHALRAHTSAAWPFADSMVTWASAYATLLVARKVYENWHWWLIIDSAALYLYFTRHLYATMLLFGLYLVLIGFGMREWRRSMAAHAG